MNVLAIDTCSGHGSIALARATPGEDAAETQSLGQLLGQAELSAEWTSTALHGAIAGLLKQHGLRTADLDGYAVTNGPGGFTAVRVGAAAVKGLAEAHNKPVAAVSTLELIAQAAWKQTPHTAAYVPIMDARRAQVFGAIYKVSGASLELDGAETVGPLRELLSRCGGQYDLRFCATELSEFTAAIAEAGFPASSIIRVPSALAATLAEMGIERLRSGQGVPAAAVDANYVRRSDAELFWKG